MNRVIKFKGKRIDNGEWGYGNFVEKTRWDLHKDYFVTWNSLTKNQNDLLTDSEYIEEQVDHYTIGQFTGLYDKNGKEIYEGDILHIREYDNELFDNFNDVPNRFELFSIDEIRGKLRKEYITPVTWIDGVFCFSSEYNKPNYRDDMLLCCLFGDMRRSSTIFEFEIIGNIHENPEFIEGGGK